MSDNTPHKKVALANLHLSHAHKGFWQCYNRWKDYFFVEDQNLANGAFLVWTGSLYDIIGGSAAGKRIDQIKKHAATFNLPIFDQQISDLDLMCQAAQEVLSLYNADEQFFLNHYRDQRVHGFLEGQITDGSKMKYYENGTIHNDTFTVIERWETVLSSIYNRDFDGSISRLRIRMTPQVTPKLQDLEKILCQPNYSHHLKVQGFKEMEAWKATQP